MSLEEQVSKARQVIHTDAYPMSIGELINIYRDGDIDIHPEFQRQYRWKPFQKSRLIESILLGIPLPSIFVAQREDGVWDVVDGLQRISTILSFVGELKTEQDDDGREQEAAPLVLEATPYLGHLRNVSWKGENGTSALPDELKRAFKREKIDLKIIKRESDENAKFELFQRLNTGGAALSEQEVRNCLLIMLKREAYLWLKGLSESPEFLACIALSERLAEEKYPMELVLRFFIATRLQPNDAIDESDMGPFLTSKMKKILVDEDVDFHSESQLFIQTFGALSRVLVDDAFKRFSPTKDRYEGQFSVSLFEYLTSGVAHLVATGKPDDLIDRAITSLSRSVVEDAEFVAATRHGQRGIARFPKLVELARRQFDAFV